MPSLRRTVAAALACALLTAGCATDFVAAGGRPHKPVSTAVATTSAETDPSKLAVALDSLPGYTAPEGNDGQYVRTLSDEGHLEWHLVNAAGNPVTVYEPPGTVAWGAAGTYSMVPGILTAGGSQQYAPASSGTTTIDKRSLTLAWTADVGTAGTMPAGWDSQPLVVTWPEVVRKALGYPGDLGTKDLSEVVYASPSGALWRLDLDTGEPTKPAIELGTALLGTPAIDANGYPLAYATRDDGGQPRLAVIDLIKGQEVAGWTVAATGSVTVPNVLMNRQADTLFVPLGGSLAKVRTGVRFDPATKRISLAPQFVRLAYNLTPPYRENGVPAITTTPVAWRNLMYAVDAKGYLLCWDATTLEMLWAKPLGDTAAQPTLEETADGAFLYLGTQVNLRGDSNDRAANLLKIDAATGATVWKYDIPTMPVPGAATIGAPLVGQGEAGDLVVFSIARTTSPQESTVLALDRATGQVAWERHLASTTWSTPVAFTGSDGHQYAVAADSTGTLRLFDPGTGVEYANLALGASDLSSLTVFNGTVLVASYSGKLFAVRLG